MSFKGAERYVLRDWLDLFNHRLTSLFHRAWEKYRFWIAYERSHRKHPAPHTFTACLFSLIGQGMPTLRNRLQVSLREEISGRSREQVLARVEDLSLLRYVGILSQRRRSAMNLEALLADYFRVPVHVEQFQGQWLQLVRDNQSRLDANEQAARLGVNVVVEPEYRERSFIGAGMRMQVALEPAWLESGWHWRTFGLTCRASSTLPPRKPPWQPAKTSSSTDARSG